MMEEQDYCQYIISKCVAKGCSSITNRFFRTPEEFLNSYEGSSCFRGSVGVRNQKLVECMSKIIRQETEKLGQLTPDTERGRVLSRCLEKLSTVNSYEDIFTAVSNFLWLMASKRAAKGDSFSLTDNAIQERKYTVEWIAELEEKIKEAKYDLNCMEEAAGLSIGKQFLLGLVKNSKVRCYANRENMSSKELKQRITDRRRYLNEYQLASYAFIATAIYREDLRRRYH